MSIGGKSESDGQTDLVSSNLVSSSSSLAFLLNGEEVSGLVE